MRTQMSLRFSEASRDAGTKGGCKSVSRLDHRPRELTVKYAYDRGAPTLMVPLLSPAKLHRAMGREVLLSERERERERERESERHRERE